MISTKANKNEPTYRLSARVASSASGSDYKETSVQAPFMRWFTADGFFVAQPFQQWLASSVPFVGEVDPKSKAGAAAQTAAPEATLQPGISAASESSTTQSSSAGGSKRRKG